MFFIVETSLLTFVSYAVIATLAFWLGQGQVFSEENLKKVESDEQSVALVDDSNNQRDVNNEVAKLTHDLEQAKESNRVLKTQLATVLKPVLAMNTENDRRCGLLSEKLNLGLYEEA